MGAFLAIGIVAYFSLYAYYASYTRFIADDYCSAYYGQRLGMFRYIWFWFITWGGRFSAIAADMALVWLGQKSIGLIPGLALVFWFFTNFAGFYLLLPTVTTRKEKTALASLFSLLFLYSIFQLITNLPQTFLWYSAFRTHTLPVLLFNFFLVFTFSYRKHIINSRWALILAFLFCLFNGGFSESFTAIQIISLASLLGIEIFYFRKNFKDRILHFLIVSLLAAGIALAIMLLSPGTQNRQDYFEVPQTIGQILGISIDGFFTFFRVILKDAFRILGLVGSILFAFLIGHRYFPGSSIKNSQAFLIAMTGVALVFIAYLPAAYGMGDILPRRAFPIPIFFGFVPLFYFFGVIGSNTKRSPISPSILWYIATGLILISLIGNGANFYARTPLLVQYASNIDSLEVSIEQAKSEGKKRIEIPKLNNWAGVYDPSDNPMFWVTSCFRMYYDIEVVGPPTQTEYP